MDFAAVASFVMHRAVSEPSGLEPAVRALADTLIGTSIACSVNVALLSQFLLSVLDCPAQTISRFRVDMSILLASTFVVLLASNIATVVGIFGAVRYGQAVLTKVLIADGVAAVGYRLASLLPDCFCVAYVVWLLVQRRKRHSLDPSKARLDSNDLMLTVVLPAILMTTRAAVFGFEVVAVLECRARKTVNGDVELPPVCADLATLESIGVSLSFAQSCYIAASLWYLRKRDMHWHNSFMLGLFSSATLCRLMLHSAFLLNQRDDSYLRPFDTFKLFRLGDAQAAIVVAFALHHLTDPTHCSFELFEPLLKVVTPVLPRFASPSFRTEDTSYFATFEADSLHVLSPTYHRR